MPLSKDTKHIVDTRTQELPPQLVAIASDDLRKFVTDLAGTLDLSPENTASLENEIALIILAFEPIEDLARNIVEYSTINEKIASYIAEKVTDQLLAENFDALVEINEQQHYADMVADTSSTETDPASDMPTQPTPDVTDNISKHPDSAIRTMPQDVDRVHGYGAYRKMYPDTTVTQTATQPKQDEQHTGESETVPAPAGDPIIQALSQEETITGRTQLTATPSYTEETPAKQPPQT